MKVKSFCFVCGQVWGTIRKLPCSYCKNEKLSVVDEVVTKIQGKWTKVSFIGGNER